MINETYLSLVNAYYDIIKTPNKKITSNMKKYKKLLKNSDKYSDNEYDSEYAKIIKELIDDIGKDDLLKIFKAKIKKIYEIKKRPLNIDLDKYDSFLIEKIYNSIYSTLTEKEKKQLLSKINRKVYKVFNREEYKEAKKDRLNKEIREQLLHMLNPEYKKKILNPLKQRPLIIKSQNQVFKLPTAYYQQKTDNPEQKLRSLYNIVIKEDIKRDDIDNKLNLTLENDGINIDISTLGGEFKEYYDNFNKIYRDLIKLKVEQQKDYNLSDLDRKYYIEKYKDFTKAKNDLLYAYEDSGIDEARELIKLNNEIEEYIKEKYNVIQKPSNNTNQKLMSQENENLETNENESNEIKDKKKYIEKNKVEYKKDMVNIDKKKLARFLELYNKINENGKLKKLVDERCLLLSPSMVKYAITNNKYNPDDEENTKHSPPPASLSEAKGREGSAFSSHDEETEDEDDKMKDDKDKMTFDEDKMKDDEDKMTLGDDNVKHSPPKDLETSVQEEQSKIVDDFVNKGIPPYSNNIEPDDTHDENIDVKESEAETSISSDIDESKTETDEENRENQESKFNFIVSKKYEKLDNDDKIKIIDEYKRKLNKFKDENLKGNENHAVNFESGINDYYINDINDINEKLNIDFNFVLNRIKKGNNKGKPRVGSYKKNINDLIEKCDKKIEILKKLKSSESSSEESSTSSSLSEEKAEPSLPLAPLDENNETQVSEIQEMAKKDSQGHGLKGFKHLKINPIMKGGPPKIKGFAEALKEKQNKSINKNNSCLIGGRILSVNELDQIIDRIKKQ